MGKLVVRDLAESRFQTQLKWLCEDFCSMGILYKIKYLDALCTHYYSADTPASISVEHGKIQRICALLHMDSDLDRAIESARRSTEAATADIEWLRIAMSRRAAYQDQISGALENVNAAMVVAYLKQRAIDAGDLIEA